MVPAVQRCFGEHRARNAPRRPYLPDHMVRSICNLHFAGDSGLMAGPHSYHPDWESPISNVAAARLTFASRLQQRQQRWLLDRIWSISTMRFAASKVLIVPVVLYGRRGLCLPIRRWEYRHSRTNAKTKILEFSCMECKTTTLYCGHACGPQWATSDSNEAVRAAWSGTDTSSGTTPCTTVLHGQLEDGRSRAGQRKSVDVCSMFTCNKIKAVSMEFSSNFPVWLSRWQCPCGFGL